MNLLAPHPAKGLLLSLGSFFFLLFGCQKGDRLQLSPSPPSAAPNHYSGSRINPFSIRNIKNAIQFVADNRPGTSGRKTVAIQTTPSRLVVNTDTGATQYPTFVYFKFNPNNITPAQFDSIQNDTTFQAMEIPFADPAVYNDTALDSTAIEQLGGCGMFMRWSQPAMG